MLLIPCLFATIWYLDREQRAGKFQQVDDMFLDFLVANARERLTQPDPKAVPEVVLVPMREEDRAEYAAWPPPPLDWQTVLKGLQPYDPAVLVVTTPLNWGRPAPDFIPAVAEALARFPSVVLGVEAQLAAGQKTEVPVFMGGLEEALPRFQRVVGDATLAPGLSALITAPEMTLRAQGELGLLGAVLVGGSWHLPYAVQEGGTLLPTVLAQVLALQSRTPYALHRLRLGPGGGAYLSQGLFVPLEATGEVPVPTAAAVSTVNALNLMSGTLTDGTNAEDKTALGIAKIVVVGLDSEATGEVPRFARLYAQALAHILSLPRLSVLSQGGQWFAWGLAALGALGIVLRVRRDRAWRAGLGLIFAALVASFLIFQTSLLWCPPTIPAALIAVGALVGMAFGERRASVVS